MDIITYALLKKRITSALTGIKDVRLTPDGKSLEFETNDGTVFTITIPQKDVVYVGPTAPNPDDYELWVDTLDPGGSITPGGGDSTLQADLTASTVIGSVTKGKFYPAGTSLEKIIRDILTTYEKPTITIGTDPAKSVYNAATETLSSIEITANVGKKTEDIEFVKFYVDGKLVHTTMDSTITSGGVFKYVYTFPTPTNKTFTVKVETRDNMTKTLVSSQATVTFVNECYQGVIEDGTPIDEAHVSVLTPDLKKTVAGTYTYTATYGRFVYAYPASLGTVSSVKDLVNNFNYTASCTYGTMVINGVAYNLIYLTDPMGFSNVKITFA